MSTEVYKKLNDSIKESLVVLNSLFDSIIKEREAIERQDIDSLIEATNEKSKIFDETQVVFNKRVSLFDTLGVERNQTGFTKYIKRLTPPQEKRLSEEWDKLVELLEKTQQEIKVNQKIIHKSKENNSKVLDILQGKKPENDLYGKTGERKNMPYQTSIIKA